MDADNTHQASPITPRPALQRILIPGTDADVLASYATLTERAREAVFGAFEDDVIILDVETTGLSYQRDSLIEIAAVRQRGPSIFDRFSTFVDPGRPIPQQITELTSISDADVSGAPDALTALAELAEFISDTPVIAHNSDFDQNMLRYASDRSWDFIEQNPWIDSIELARISLPRCRSHGLQSLTAAFCDFRSTHRAIDDTISLAQLWRIMLTALTDLPPGLIQFIAQLYPSATWPLRAYIRQVAGSLPTTEKSFALEQARQTRVLNRPKQEKQDALELLGGRQVLQPVTEEAVQRAFTEQGLLGQMYNNFESRQEQTDMALAVAQALNNHQHLAVEAGTGVGKSMAYLLPLALFARENKVCCGVATKTNTLLDQLLYSELPRLAAALPEGLLFEALKGYDHYPCLRKLRNLCRQTDRPIGKNGITTIASLLSFVCQSSRGDLDRLRLRFDDISRYEVVCNADDCLKRRCRFYQNCLLHGARRAAADADIVLTNQALLFCDVTTSGGILPSIRHWVIDEAHGAEDEARDQLSKAVSARDLAANLDALLGRRGAIPALRDACQPLAEALPLVARIDSLLTEVAVAPVICQSFASELKQLSQLAESSAYDQVDLWINQAVRESGPWAALYSTGASLSHRLTKLLGECQMIVGLANEFTELAEAQADLIGLCSELATHIDALDLILNGDDLSYVYSAEIDRRADQSTDRLLAARIDVGEVLATQLYPDTLSVIFTSATLAAGSSFDYFARASGLANLPSEAWSSLQLASSYDFDHNMTVFLPTDLPEPNQSGYREALAELLFQVHTALGGSVLTLFTNRREMEDLYQRLKDRLEETGVQLRCQWRGYANRRLSEEFIANRELSLFALRSFWQGFDAPGDTLRCVIIPKLPFGRPTDPLACERAQRERDSWKRYVLPEAIIDLRQAAGRLIRSSTDQGALILADSRLLTKWYGQAFIEALPSQQRYTLDTQSIAEALRQSGL